MKALADMKYSGRGLIVGATLDGNDFFGYTLTGRSPPSQARDLVEGEETGTIRTDVTDREQLEKGSPALLIYPAFTHLHHILMGSNGAQTQLLYSAVIRNESDLDGLTSIDLVKDAFKQPVYLYDKKDDRFVDITTYEPDAPNNTPRVSAMVMNGVAAMHIVWKGNDGRRQSRIFDLPLMDSGEGYLLTTYQGGNESPLAPFRCEPREVEVVSTDVAGLAEEFYAAIEGGAEPGDNFRVAAAVALLNRRTGGLETAIINRSERGE